ncbi:MAG: hypothetical protein UT02_C0017G0009 [Parcubacteria group bacterium GW2011_GWC2_38_7]|nr:MAG: hypothetical protein UT02_C0017G0009 [Parcubacteria group bacterium GW2011_GWC2_38_7]
MSYAVVPIEQVIGSFFVGLLLLGLVLHGLLTMLQMPKVIPKLAKSLIQGLARGIGWLLSQGLTYLGQGTVWVARWLAGLVRDLAVAIYRGIFRPLPALGDGHDPSPVSSPRLLTNGGVCLFHCHAEFISASQ